MAAAIQGLGELEAASLTTAMRDSGTCWRLAEDVPGVVDKHSTGGVGDKVSLVLAPVLAALDIPVAMLTGRALGHTGGTADKLESIAGVDLALDRDGAVRSLEQTGMAIGIATEEVAPADRRLYALRDRTATVSSIPLVIASILSKKLATGTAAIVFDVKTGDGAFFPDPEVASELAQRLVDVSNEVGCPARALLTDMSQPLGRAVGHAVEVEETIAYLEGRADERLSELTNRLVLELAALRDQGVDLVAIEETITSGRARECFEVWARHRGASSDWQAKLERAPSEHVVCAEGAGYLARVETRRLGEIVGHGGRPGQHGSRGAAGLDHGVGLIYEARLGERVVAGQPLARLFLRQPDEGLVSALEGCFEVREERIQAPAIVRRSFV